MSSRHSKIPNIYILKYNYATLIRKIKNIEYKIFLGLALGFFYLQKVVDSIFNIKLKDGL